MNLCSTHDVVQTGSILRTYGRNFLPVLYFNPGLLDIVNPCGFRNRSEKITVCLVLQIRIKMNKADIIYPPPA
jgi:hypothetical protein